MKKSITTDILRKLRRVDSEDDKLGAIKDAYKGDTAFILSCGPSTAVIQDKLDIQELFRDKLLIGIKQASMLAPCDFQLFNAIRFNKFERLDASTISVASGPTGNPNRIGILKHCPDIWHECDTKKPRLIESLDWESAVFKRNMPYHPWGPGIVLDTGIWLALHLGVKRIVVIGWDMSKDYKHFYKDDEPIGEVEQEFIDNEFKLMKNASLNLHNWLRQKKQVDLIQCSPCSELPIPAIMPIDLWDI